MAKRLLDATRDPEGTYAVLACDGSIDGLDYAELTRLHELIAGLLAEHGQVNAAPVVEQARGVTYIDVGDVQISIDAEGEALVTCPPELLGAAAVAWADPRVQAAVAQRSGRALAA